MSSHSVALAVCVALLLGATCLVVSTGWRHAAVSPPLWWTLAAFAYTVIPIGLNAVGRATHQTLVVLVSDAGISQYLVYVGMTTLALSGGWLIGHQHRERPVRTFNPPGNISHSRLILAVAAAITLNAASALLSGINPTELLLTVNTNGTNFYAAEGYKFSFLRSLALPVLIYGAALLVYAALETRSRPRRHAAIATYLSALLILILSGVRAHLILLLSATALALVLSPRAATLPRARRLFHGLVIALVLASLYPIALWMESRRSVAGRSAPVQSDLGGFLDLVTPSAALFDWVQAWGFRVGVSLSDALEQAPPSILVPNTPRAKFLEIVDTLNVSGAGAAVSSPAELYLNAGWVGGIAIALTLGLALGVLQSRLESRGSAAALVGLLALGPCSAQIFTRGYLWQSAFLLASVAAAAWVLGHIAQPTPNRQPAKLHASKSFDNHTTSQ